VGAATDARGDLAARIDTIEASYEFFLAFAAQGTPADATGGHGQQVRAYLQRFDDAVSGLADVIRAAGAGLSDGQTAALRAFADVVARDGGAAQAAVRLVNAQPGVGSQLIDNLNASIHVRALLTDLFLVDEVLGPDTVRPDAGSQPEGGD
jgi:hypothetical protein